MPMFSSLPDWVAYLFTALIIFAFLVLIYLLIDWLRLQRQMRKLREELEHATRERDRNARIMGSMDRQKALLQDQVQKANDQVDTLTEPANDRHGPGRVRPRRRRWRFRSGRGPASPRP